nr:protein trichome birefringence-like 19 [Ipomoea batatas]
MELSSCKSPTLHTIILPLIAFTLIFLVAFSLHRPLITTAPQKIAAICGAANLTAAESIGAAIGGAGLREPPAPEKCDIFVGEWIPNAEAPYYTNETCYSIQEHQNCMKYGRPDSEYLKWRWKPEGCELPVFDPRRFLELGRNKSLAFVGDSIARNHFQSLGSFSDGGGSGGSESSSGLSKGKKVWEESEQDAGMDELLADMAEVAQKLEQLEEVMGSVQGDDLSNFASETVAYPVDISNTTDDNRKHMLYKDYNFTVRMFWSPYLVKTGTTFSEVNTKPFELYLDEFDESWTSEISTFDYLIINAGHWFFRPTKFYLDGQLVGCLYCPEPNLTHLTEDFSYRWALRTAFRAINSLESFKGVTFLRSFAPQHFENGAFDQGGACVRTEPFKRNDTILGKFKIGMYDIQKQEFAVAVKEGRRKGSKFRLFDVTQAMLLRPDGHPNGYGHWPNPNFGQPPDMEASDEGQQYNLMKHVLCQNCCFLRTCSLHCYFQTAFEGLSISLGSFLLYESHLQGLLPGPKSRKTKLNKVLHQQLLGEKIFDTTATSAEQEENSSQGKKTSNETKTCSLVAEWALSWSARAALEAREWAWRWGRRCEMSGGGSLSRRSWIARLREAALRFQLLDVGLLLVRQDQRNRIWIVVVGAVDVSALSDHICCPSKQPRHRGALLLFRRGLNSQLYCLPLN